MANIFGTSGNDNLTGTDLDDLIIGFAGYDTLSGGDGNDQIFGDSTADSLLGGNGNDFLYGGEDSDFLDGQRGIDTLIGGTGNDSYRVDSTTDTIIESADGGRDSVEVVDASVSYTLPDNVEDLTMSFFGFINVTGNALDNTMSGNVNNNILNGGGGNDTLSGGARGNDTLIGGAGNDLLTSSGDSGAEQFVFDSGFAFASADLGVDTIGNFSFDSIVLDKTTFFTLSSVPGNGFSVPSEFAVVGSDEAAATSSAAIVYNSANGNLFYNQNGTEAGFGIGALFATVNAPGPGGIGPAEVSAESFFIQA
jgi:Ca2+-binding RTX toxin-like protein